MALSRSPLSWTPLVFFSAQLSPLPLYPTHSYTGGQWVSSVHDASLVCPVSIFRNHCCVDTRKLGLEKFPTPQKLDATRQFPLTLLIAPRIQFSWSAMLYTFLVNRLRRLKWSPILRYCLLGCDTYCTALNDS